jgi:hypothetical protein
VIAVYVKNRGTLFFQVPYQSVVFIDSKQAKRVTNHFACAKPKIVVTGLGF